MCLLLFLWRHLHRQVLGLYSPICPSRRGQSLLRMDHFAADFRLQPVPVLWRHQLARQRGADVYPQSCQHGFFSAVLPRDDPQVDCLWPVEIFHQRLDLSRLCHRLCKSFLGKAQLSPLVESPTHLNGIQGHLWDQDLNFLLFAGISIELSHWRKCQLDCFKVIEDSESFETSACHFQVARNEGN